MTMLRKLFVALTVATAAAVAFPSNLARQAEDFATCHYVFIPAVPVDPATTNLVSEFNYITGRALAIAVTPNTIHVYVQGPGSTFTENPDDVFHVDNQLSADGWTCAQTKEFMENLAGSNQVGFSGITWLIQSSECSCDN